MVDWRAWAIAGAMVAVIYASRAAILGMLRLRAARQLLWIAPRGLITVLLFLTATDTGTIADFPFGTVMLVVLVTATATALAHRAPEPVAEAGEGTAGAEPASEAADAPVADDAVQKNGTPG
jgi:hypothetical protein